MAVGIALAAAMEHSSYLPMTGAVALSLGIAIQNFPEGAIVSMPYLLSFAAGAMMYVVVEELIPETQEDKHSNLGTIGFAIGFLLMMTLDVLLG